MVDRYCHLRFREESRRRVAQFGLFDIYTSRRVSAHKGEGEFILVAAPEWVTIVPYVPEKDAFLMVRQFRHGSSSLTLEFPAGVVHQNEPPIEAAARELREETGHRAGTLEKAGSVNPNPAFMTNEVHTFVAEDLTYEGDLELDEHEVIDVETVSVSEVAERLGEDPFTSGIMVISFTWFLRRRDRLETNR